VALSPNKIHSTLFTDEQGCSQALAWGGFSPPKLNVSSPQTEFANFDISVWKCTKMHYFTQNTTKFSGDGAQPPPKTPLLLGRGTPVPQTLPSRHLRHLNSLWLLVLAPWWLKPPHSKNAGYVTSSVVVGCWVERKSPGCRCEPMFSGTGTTCSVSNAVIKEILLHQLVNSK